MSYFVFGIYHVQYPQSNVPSPMSIFSILYFICPLASYWGHICADMSGSEEIWVGEITTTKAIYVGFLLISSGDRLFKNVQNNFIIFYKYCYWNNKYKCQLNKHPINKVSQLGPAYLYKDVNLFHYIFLPYRWSAG